MGEKMNSKNKILIGIIAIIVIVALIFIIGSNRSTGNIVLKDSYNLQKVSIRLPIPIKEAGSTPIFIAKELGFYKEEGLDLSINLGSPELNPVKMVANGTDTFGLLGGPDTLIVARSKNIPIEVFAILHRNSNFPVIITLKDSNITKVKQLENKKVGFFYGHISTDVLRALFKKEDVNIQEVDVGFNYNPLISKQIDAEWAFRTTAGVNLPSKGIKINMISPSDYGINTQGYTLFTRDEIIKDNPELVQKFWRATEKGIQYTLEHPEKAIEIFHKIAPDTNKSLEYKRLKLYNAVTSNSKQYPIGYMDYQMFKETYDRLKKENVLKNSFNVQDAFTTRFLN